MLPLFERFKHKIIICQGRYFDGIGLYKALTHYNDTCIVLNQLKYFITCLQTYVITQKMLKLIMIYKNYNINFQIITNISLVAIFCQHFHQDKNSSEMVGLHWLVFPLLLTNCIQYIVFNCKNNNCGSRFNNFIIAMIWDHWQYK